MEVDARKYSNIFLDIMTHNNRTKLGTRIDDVDEWLDIHNFKLKNDRDIIYYTRYIVVENVQYKIVICCEEEDNAWVNIEDCNSNNKYENNIDFKCWDKSLTGNRKIALCKTIIDGLVELGIDLTKYEYNYEKFTKHAYSQWLVNNV